MNNQPFGRAFKMTLNPTFPVVINTESELFNSVVVLLKKLSIEENLNRLAVKPVTLRLEIFKFEHDTQYPGLFRCRVIVVGEDIVPTTVSILTFRTDNPALFSSISPACFPFDEVRNLLDIMEI